MRSKSLLYVTTFALVLALLVIMLGAYTRLTDAGLGCPDWPGCYGHMVVPSIQSKLSQAQSHYPLNPIEPTKAWTEMVHRYAAGTLALLIGFIFLRVFIKGATHTDPRLKILPGALVLFVLFQALLGMWTVTLKLLPVVVMAHLLGGILIFVSLCLFRWQLSTVCPLKRSGYRFWIGLGALIVFCQIALGGWVSSNYAGMACIGFPTCNGSWLPKLDFSAGFHLCSPLGANYQGGLLENDARVTVQYVHRIGALITTIYILMLSIVLLARIKNQMVKITAWLAVLLLLIQLTLGVINVIYLLPLWASVAHNGVAALLLASLGSLFYLVGGGPNVHRG